MSDGGPEQPKLRVDRLASAMAADGAPAQAMESDLAQGAYLHRGLGDV